MVTCDLQGGLGNLLFQISTTYALAKDNKDDCVFNFKKHDTQPRLQSNNASSYKSNFFRNIKEGTFSIEHTYIEKEFSYRSIEYKKNIMIHGYFQTEKYFKHRKDEILDLYTIPDVIKKTLLEKINIDLNNTTSVHIRRGDYKNPSVSKVLPVLEKEYYEKALVKCNTPHYLIFSDEIDWCKQNFKRNDFIYVNLDHDYEELYLMSLCKNNITANSSFSWWGAWLNRNENKKVICPSKWFVDGRNYNDIYAEGFNII